MSYIPQKFFQRYTKIVQIYLKGCGIKSIDGYTFPSDSKFLKVLSLAHNNLSKLHEYSFKYAPNITNLDFSHNLISQIDQKTFRGAEQKLEKINLAHK